VLLSAGIAALIALLVLTQSGIISTAGSAEFSDFFRGFQMGSMTGVIGIFIFIMVKSLKVLSSEATLKTEYYAENDERKKLIMLKIGGTPMYVCAVAILLAGIVAGYFNKTVFFSLLICALFLLVTRGILKVYYHKKF
jgi:hypothetical protein